MTALGSAVASSLKVWSSSIKVQRNFGITNLKGPKILFLIVEVLLLQGLFIIKLTKEGLRIKFFIAGILLLKVSLYRGFSVFINSFYLISRGMAVAEESSRRRRRSGEEVGGGRGRGGGVDVVEVKALPRRPP
jgi:hypothetical protein